MAVTDVHAHILVPSSLQAMREAHPDAGPELITDEAGGYLRYPGRERLGPMPAQMFDVDARMAATDRQRVDIQTLAVPPPQFHYHVPRDVGIEFARLQNDGMLGIADAHPERFRVFPTLPLQDIDAAITEIERVAAHPLVRGVEIGSNVNGTNLDDQTLEPLWEALEARDLPVWVHPDQRSIAGADRISLEMLGKRVGWDHVVLGSDFPFDMASDDPVGAVEVLGLPQDQQKAVLETNAETFLRPTGVSAPPDTAGTRSDVTA